MAISEPPEEGSSGVKLSALASVLPLEVPTIWAPELAKKLPPVSWTSSGLTIAPGRPSVIAGKGGVRKGWLAMGIMLSGACDLPLLGRIPIRSGLRSVYCDYEQSARVTQERFQMLAGGMQISLESLGKRLGYRWRPIPTWAPRPSDHQKTIDAVCRQCDGIDLLIVDSVRACAAGVVENSNEASLPLDIAIAASEKTGCCILFLDHAGKPKEGAERVDLQRGHSSKLDACQTLLALSATKGKPTLVTCERSQVASEDDWPADFSFTLARGAGGLTLVEVAALEKPTAAATLQTVCDALVKVLGDNEGASTVELRSLLAVRLADVMSARDALERKGIIVNRGTGQRPSWYLGTTPETPF